LAIFWSLSFITLSVYATSMTRSCFNQRLAEYLSKAVVGCRKSIEDGKLSRVSVCFFDGEHHKTDEVCVRFGSFPKVDEKNAAPLHNWFRESLLVLESRLSA
jgi:hypothetical protein